MSGYSHYQGGGEKTVYKTIVLEKYMQSYLNIMKENWYGPKYYIDTHAGTGYTIPFNTENTRIPGSALRALRKSFDKYYFYEKDESNFDTLVDTVESEINRDLRIDELKGPNGSLVRAKSSRPEIEILNVDCHQGIQRLINETNDQPHWLVFIDPEGFSADRTLVESICGRGNVDLFINFQTTGIYRNLSEYQDRVEQTIGENYPSDVNNMDELVNWYKNDLFEQMNYQARSRSMTSINDNWRYDLIFASQADVAGKIINEIFTGDLKGDAKQEIVDHRDTNDCSQIGLEDFTVKEHDRDQSSLDRFR